MTTRLSKSLGCTGALKLAGKSSVGKTLRLRLAANKCSAHQQRKTRKADEFAINSFCKLRLCEVEAVRSCRAS
jgi:hypothetical protein